MASKRDLVTRWKKQSEAFAKMAKDYQAREEWDTKLVPVTRSAHWRAMAEMANEHANALDVATK